MASPQRVSLLPGVTNHRHGRVIGDGGVRLVRTFHARFGSVKMGGAVTARTRLAYVHREGKHEGGKADVEATAGDREKVIRAADRIRDTARVRRGKTAERILATQVIELPLESDEEQRQACAEAFVADWRKRGHEAVAVVHVHGEEHDQPHLHVEIAARPVHADGSVDRSGVLWRGREPVYAERQIVADIVNRTCEPDPPYHPGGFRDMTDRKDDKPRTRMPSGKFREAREEIREARAAGDEAKAERIESSAYAVSRTKRNEKRWPREDRKAEIDGLKDAKLWRNGRAAGERQRLVFAADARADKAEAGQGADLEKYRTWSDDYADSSRKREKAARERTQKAEGELRELTERQTELIVNAHSQARRELPELRIEEGRAEAWAFVRRVLDEGLEVERKRKAWAAEKERRAAEPPAEAKAWQVTATEWLERARDNSGGDYSDVTFAGIVPAARLHCSPDNERHFSTDESGVGLPWVYERGGELACGLPDVKHWLRSALTAHVEEIKNALYHGEDVPAAVLASHPGRELRDIWSEADQGEDRRGGGGGRRQSGGDGGGMEMGGPVIEEKTQQKSRAPAPEIAPPPPPPVIERSRKERQRHREIDLDLGG